MASTFSDLGIELMSTGENAGTWGDKTNTNLQIVEKAVAGYVEKSIAGGAATTTLTITDGTTTESDSIARHAVIKLTGSITGNQIVTVPDSIEKVYIITNGTSGAFTVQFKTASGTGITFGVSEKTTRLVYSDGTNLVDAGFGGSLDVEGRELILDADGDTSLTADTDDQIDIKIAGTDQLTIKDGALSPVTDNDIDLGTSTLEFKDAFFDGTVTSDAFAGPLTGNVTGNVSGTAATVTTAAQSNITSLGTLTTLTVDNVIINGSTIGHTGDTDLITVASGIATVAGEVSMTTLDIGGTNVTSTAAEINLIDGGATVGTTAIADGDGLLINDAGTMRVSTVQTLAAYLDDEITAMPNLVSTGALNSGSITSGFGTIDTGSSTITTTGLISGGSLDIDNVLINGTTIGHTDDTDLITLADGIATVAGEISVTTLDIGGTNVTSTAAELNLLDDKDATHLAVPGKIGGTNFGNSLLVGHATTGTISSANDNTGVGLLALDALTSGDANIALGFTAGTNVNSGNRNSYLGADSGRRATTGSDNTVVGNDSAYYNVTGSDNTALGSNALEGVDGNSFSNNTAIGSSALKAITTGASNIGFGKDAGDNITSGDGNVIIGSINADSATGDKQLIVADGVDGSVAWIKGDSSGNLTFGGTITVGSATVTEAQLEILDGATITTTELNLIDGGATVGTTAIADGDGLLINDAGTMRVSTVQTLAAYLDDEITSMPNLTTAAALVTVSALDAGSITSGFGAIDNGTSNIRSATITAETAFVPDASGGADLGTTALEFNDAFFNDGAVINFGNDQDTTLTHTDGTGLTLNSTNKLCFNDATQFIQGASGTVLDIAATDEIELTATLIDVVGNLAASGTLAQAGVATFALAANVAQVAITSSSNAVAWDASAAANAYHITTENTTFSAPSNNVEGAFIVLEINYNGSHTIAFNTIFEFAASTAPTTTDTDGKTDILVFRFNGAVWQEVGRTLNLSES